MSQHDAHHGLCEDILLAVGARPDTRIWRQPTGKFLTMGRRDVITIGIRGQADLSGVLACGRRLEIEVKTGTGKRRPDQRTWGRVMDDFGAVYCVARSVEDAVNRIQEHVRGCEACSARTQRESRGHDSGAQGINRGR